METFLAAQSPTLLLAIILGLLVILMRLRVPISAAFVCGAVLTFVLFSVAPLAAVRAAVGGVFSEPSIFLALMVMSITVFSVALVETGQTQRIINAFKAIVGPSRLSLVAFPALIGLLPMPGGAVFSAPMVDAAIKETGVSPERASIANYWFRHIWEFWFPFYPGVILALTLSGAPTGRFILMQLPMTIFALAIGYLVILRGVSLGQERQRNVSRANVWRFVVELTPIGMVVAVVILSETAAMNGLLNEDSIVLRRSPLLLGLVLAVIWLVALRGLRWGAFLDIFRRKQIWDMVLMVAGLMVFQAAIESSGAIDRFRAELDTWSMPLAVVVGVLPFVAGVVVAVAFGLVGTSFPFIVPLILALPAGQQTAWFCMAYTMGYVGMMISPVHVCLILTVQYFKADLLRVYAFLAPICAACLGFGIGLFYFYRWLGL